MAPKTLITPSRKRWKPANSWRFWNVDDRWCRRYDRRRKQQGKPPVVEKLAENYWQERAKKLREEGTPGLGTTQTALYRESSIRQWWRRQGWKSPFFG